MTTPESPSALLLRAADHLDELAGSASKGPWMAGATAPHLVDEVIYGQSASWPGHIAQVANVDYGQNRGPDAAYIAAVDPLAGRDFASMLRAAADDAAACDQQNARHPDNDGKTRVMYHPMTVAAISAARNVLGEAS